MTTQIFISHAGTDADLARALINLLEAGLEVPSVAIRCTSVDGYKLEGGDDAPEVLRDNLSSSAVVLGILTATSVRSSFVLMELGAAWAFKKRAIPLIGPGASFGDLPGPFKDIHALKMDHGPDMSGLIATVAKATGLAHTHNMSKITASLSKLSEVVGASASSVGSTAPVVSVSPPAMVTKDEEAFDLVTNLLQTLPAESKSFSYDEFNELLPHPVARDTLRRVLPKASTSSWTVKAHDLSIVITYVPQRFVHEVARDGDFF
ncbi:MAG: toll/interleukin-1 receptor domain-containing protein [Thaumarchaeota archaeon]|nr:toll/interleukin-1 receptor domain-containing protein [Nitrososphaerota archaeon]